MSPRAKKPAPRIRKWKCEHTCGAVRAEALPEDCVPLCQTPDCVGHGNPMEPCEGQPAPLKPFQRWRADLSCVARDGTDVFLRVHTDNNDVPRERAIAAKLAAVLTRGRIELKGATKR